jgi:excisionase family DNA binding protein
MHSHSKTADAEKVGWRVNEWAHNIGCGRSHVYDLLGEGKIRAVKSGKATIIVTPPAEYLASLPAA